MRGLLPPGVLATRPRRTGTSESYMRDAARRAYPGLVAELSRDTRLADLGIVEPRAWREAADAALGGSGDAVVFLYFTLQTELWLRARERAPQVAGGVGATAPLGQPHG